MSEKSLISLTINHFKRRGFEVERDVLIFGISRMPQAFDLRAKKGDKEYFIYVREWNRTVGINMIIKIDRAIEDAGYGEAIFVAKKFSDHARSYSARRGMLLLTPRELDQDPRRSIKR
jgi:hypothetical protein